MGYWLWRMKRTFNRRAALIMLVVVCVLIWNVLHCILGCNIVGHNTGLDNAKSEIEELVLDIMKLEDEYDIVENRLTLARNIGDADEIMAQKDAQRGLEQKSNRKLGELQTLLIKHDLLGESILCGNARIKMDATRNWRANRGWRFERLTIVSEEKIYEIEK